MRVIPISGNVQRDAGLISLLMVATDAVRIDENEIDSARDPLSTGKREDRFVNGLHQAGTLLALLAEQHRTERYIKAFGDPSRNRALDYYERYLTAFEPPAMHAPNRARNGLQMNVTRQSLINGWNNAEPVIHLWAGYTVTRTASDKTLTDSTLSYPDSSPFDPPYFGPMLQTARWFQDFLLATQPARTGQSHYVDVAALWLLPDTIKPVAPHFSREIARQIHRKYKALNSQ